MADTAEVVAHVLSLPGLKVAALVPNVYGAEAAVKAGVHHIGHTELYQELADNPPVATMLISGEMRVVHVVQHMSLLESLKQQGLVQKTVDSLTLEEKTLLKLRYGVLQDDELTLRDIGEILGLSRERVRQIESRAEAKCRRSVRRR